MTWLNLAPTRLDAGCLDGEMSKGNEHTNPADAKAAGSFKARPQWQANILPRDSLGFQIKRAGTC